MGFVHFQNIALQHGVVHIALHLNAMVGQHMAVIFDVLTDFVLEWVFQPRLELVQHLVDGQLRRGIGCVVRQRDVSRHPRRHAQADAHELRLHFNQRRGFGVQGHQLGLVYLGQPAVKAVPVQHGFVGQGHIDGRGRLVKQHAHFSGTSS